MPSPSMVLTIASRSTTRSMKLRIDKAFLQQLLAQLGEQRLLIHRLIDHPEVGGIEVLIQHPRTGTVHQHQLADLIS